MPTHSNSTSPKKIGQLDVFTFLNEYWQKKPILLKGALADFPFSLSADELAGLSLDEEASARIVEQQGEKLWKTQHGPFSEEDFNFERDCPWTLLVQNVDALDEEVNSLLEYFCFIPNWRLDDIMVSYATEGAGVGPHFDYYDVFLLQGQGKRRWRFGQHCDDSSALVPNLDMKVLENFECEQDFITEQGDLLYIPAQIAHWGESIGESLTYSIGFRAPSHNELLLDCSHTISDVMSERLGEDQRYRDGNELVDASSPGEISNEAILRLQSTLSELMHNPQAVAQWIGEYSTSLKLGVAPESLPLEFAELEDWKEGKSISLSRFNRSAFTHINNATFCFINGDKYSFELELAKKISNYQTFGSREVNQDDCAQIEHLLYHRKLFVLAED